MWEKGKHLRSRKLCPRIFLVVWLTNDMIRLRAFLIRRIVKNERGLIFQISYALFLVKHRTLTSSTTPIVIYKLYLCLPSRIPSKWCYNILINLMYISKVDLFIRIFCQILVLLILYKCVNGKDPLPNREVEV